MVARCENYFAPNILYREKFKMGISELSCSADGAMTTKVHLRFNKTYFPRGKKRGKRQKTKGKKSNKQMSNV